MISSTMFSKRLERTYLAVAVGLLYVFTSALVLDLFWEEWGEEIVVTYTEVSGLNGLLNETGWLPFVSRRLTPEILKGVSWFLIEVARIDGIHPKIEHSLAEKFDWWSAGPEPELYTLYLLHFMCLVATCYVWRELLRHQRTYDPMFLALAPALGLIVFPVTFTAHGMVYDLPYLLFVSLGMLFWKQCRHVWYYATFALGLLNHDAMAIMATLCFARFLVNRDHKDLLVHLAVHGALIVCIVGALKWAYQDFPSYIPPTIEHLSFLASETPYLTMRLSYAAGIPLPAGLNIGILILLMLSVGLRWQQKDLLYRGMFAFPFGLTLALFLAAGYIDEIRVFVPAFPGAFLLGMDTLWLLSREQS